jgi:BlaI family transcriptional regulator, penicillinase repressor
MKELTKAEEQLMQYLWELKKGFLKDLVEKFPEPKPAYTTVSTVIRVLTRKKFIGYKSYGKVYEYFPLVDKEDYLRKHLKIDIRNYFDGSIANFASFFANDKELDLTELEKIRKVVEEQIRIRKR